MNKQDKIILALDIGTTQVVSIIAKNDLNDKINILGIGKVQSSGINKGNIIDIELASVAIKDAVLLSRSSCDVEIDETYVTISGINTRCVRSKATTTIPSGHITSNDIKLILTRASLHEMQASSDYEVIHVIPLSFAVDGNSTIENPLNINGSRLEVDANIIMAKRTALSNIRNALKKANLDDINYVLAPYASSIATLDNDNKKLGSIVIDLGGSTSEFAVFQNKAMIYNDMISIGGNHLTSDISMILKTPLNSADEIKKKYATLIPIADDEEQQSEKIKVPLLGNELLSEEVSRNYIQKITHARVEEILILIQKRLLDSGLYHNINTIFLTGGMSKIPGIDMLTREVFQGFHVQVKNPINIQNGYVNFNDSSLSAVAGLIVYALDTDPALELDSNRNLREKKQDNIGSRVAEDINLIDTRTTATMSQQKEKEKETEQSSSFSTIFKKISEWI